MDEIEVSSLTVIEHQGWIRASEYSTRSILQFVQPITRRPSHGIVRGAASKSSTSYARASGRGTLSNASRIVFEREDSWLLPAQLKISLSSFLYRVLSSIEDEEFTHRIINHQSSKNVGTKSMRCEHAEPSYQKPHERGTNHDCDT